VQTIELSLLVECVFFIGGQSLMAYVKLEQLSRLYDGFKQSYSVDGKKLLLIVHNGQHYIIDDRCPHMDVPLVSGDLIGSDHIRCKAHGIEFSLRTGSAVGALADSIDCLKRYSVAYDGNTIGFDR